MIQFTPLRTKRLTVDLQELSLDDAEALCLMPELMDQATLTEMLRRIVKDGGRPFPGQETDPLMWTVQERIFASTHYIVHTTADGNPNFAVGDGEFSDYYLEGTDFVEEISLGDIDGDEVLMRPLLGYQAEAIERMLQMGRFRKNRVSWWAAAMACQMRRASDPEPERMSDAAFSDWLVNRTAVMRELPESEFAMLLAAFLDGSDKLSHFFRIAFSDDGIVVRPKEDPEEEVAGLPVARFPVRTAITESTLRILGFYASDEV